MSDLDAIKHDYDRDGFAVIRGYADESEVAALRRRAEEAVCRMPRNAGKFADVLKDLQHFDPWFDTELVAGRHLRLIEAVLGGRPVPASVAWFERREVTHGIEPHIDGVGREGERPVGATIWIALDAADEGNGCLHYANGSHLVAYPAGIPIPGFDPGACSSTAVCVEPGDAVVHDALTVHWSGGNASGRPRRAISYFYWAAPAMHEEARC